MPSKKPFVRRFGQVDFDSMLPLPGAAAEDTDIFVTRRGAFGANSTLTRAQIISGVGGAVTSVFGRVGDVVAAQDDYSINQLSDVDFTGVANFDLQIFVNGEWIDTAGGLTYDGIILKGGTIQGTGAGNAISVSNANGGAIRNVAAGFATPTLIPDKSQTLLGIGTSGTNGLTLTGDGTEFIRFAKLNNGIRQQSSSQTNITASNVQTQGQGVLVSSFSNVTTVAVDNDVVTLMTARAGQHSLVKNSGALILQVFPASGDDLGKGVNISTTIAPGRSKYFFTFDTTNYFPLAGDDPLLLGNGSVGDPTYSFASAPTTGVSLLGTNQLHLSSGGLSCISIRNTAGARQVGFYDGVPVSLQTGVAVTTAAIHAALVNLRLITA